MKLRQLLNRLVLLLLNLLVKHRHPMLILKVKLKLVKLMMKKVYLQKKIQMKLLKIRLKIILN